MKALRNRHWWSKPVGVCVLLLMVYLVYLAPLVDPESNLRDLPLAFVNEDGEDSLGPRVVREAQQHESSHAVKWTLLEDREQALRRISRDDFYGGVVIPADYTERVSALAAAPGTADTEPATVEILVSPAAGPAAGRPAEEATARLVDEISAGTSEQLVSRLSERGVRVPPEAAPLVAEPVRATVTDAAPVGPNSAGGLAPSYLIFLAALSGLMGAGAIHFGLPAAGSRLGLFSARLLLALLLAPVLAALETWAALGALGVGYEASAFAVFGLLAAVVSCSMAVVLLFVTYLGPAGLALGAVLNVVLGQVTSGGPAPVEALPAPYLLLADWLPFRYATDAMRALLFQQEGPEPDAIARSLWSLGAYLALAVLAGLVIAFVQDLRRREPPGADDHTAHRSAKEEARIDA